MSLFRRREPTVPVSAVVTIINATVGAMKAGGGIGIDMMYPLRDADSEGATEIVEAIAEDGDFIQTGGSRPEWEEEDDGEEEDSAD